MPLSRNLLPISRECVRRQSNDPGRFRFDGDPEFAEQRPRRQMAYGRPSARVQRSPHLRFVDRPTARPRPSSRRRHTQAVQQPDRNAAVGGIILRYQNASLAYTVIGVIPLERNRSKLSTLRRCASPVGARRLRHHRPAGRGRSTVTAGARLVLIDSEMVPRRPPLVVGKSPARGPSARAASWSDVSMHERFEAGRRYGLPDVHPSVGDHHSGAPPLLHRDPQRTRPHRRVQGVAAAGWS